jgi:hypothetical protein
MRLDHVYCFIMIFLNLLLCFVWNHG